MKLSSSKEASMGQSETYEDSKDDEMDLEDSQGFTAPFFPKHSLRKKIIFEMSLNHLNKSRDIVDFNELAKSFLNKDKSDAVLPDEEKQVPVKGLLKSENGGGDHEECETEPLKNDKTGEVDTTTKQGNEEPENSNKAENDDKDVSFPVHSNKSWDNTKKRKLLWKMFHTFMDDLEINPFKQDSNLEQEKEAKNTVVISEEEHKKSTEWRQRRSLYIVIISSMMYAAVLIVYLAGFSSKLFKVNSLKKGLKLKKEVHEVAFTLYLNVVALYVLPWLLDKAKDRVVKAYKNL